MITMFYVYESDTDKVFPIHFRNVAYPDYSPEEWLPVIRTDFLIYVAM